MGEAVNKKGERMKKILLVALIALMVCQLSFAASNEAVNPEAQPMTLYGHDTPTSIKPIAVNSGGDIKVGIADGGDVTQGAKADARSAATDTTPITEMQVLKQISYMAQNPASQAVTGTFWQATQPVSVASLPTTQVQSNNANLATEATLTKLPIAQNADLGSNNQVMMGGSVTTAKPSYTAGKIQPISLAPDGTARTQSDLNPGEKIIAGQTTVASAGTSVMLSTCNVATTAALPTCVYANGTLGVGATLTASENGVLPDQDGVTLVPTNRILVKDQVAQLQNGIYTVTGVGSAGAKWVLTRATDYDQIAEVAYGSFTCILQGIANAGAQFNQTTLKPVIGTDSIVFNTTSQVLSIAIKANSANTGNIYVGNKAVSSTRGYILDQRDFLILDTADMSDVYIDAEYSNDGVSYVALIK